jgi:hypothetical protein
MFAGVQWPVGLKNARRHGRDPWRAVVGFRDWKALCVAGKHFAILSPENVNTSKI